MQVATEGDAFIVAFHCVTDAIQWAMHAQTALLDVMWPEAFDDKEVLNCAQSVNYNDQLIFSGLRVRMAIESGPVTNRTADELTGRLRIDGVQFSDMLHNLAMVCFCCRNKSRNVCAGPFISILEVLADTGDGGQCIIGQECMKLLSQITETALSRTSLLLQHLCRYKV